MVAWAESPQVARLPSLSALPALSVFGLCSSSAPKAAFPSRGRPVPWWREDTSAKLDIGISRFQFILRDTILHENDTPRFIRVGL